MENNYLDQFERPESKFRGAPFWAWNCRLDKDTVLRQVDVFKEMGLGGFTIHCRTGLATEYMGGEFMEIVRAVVEKARRLNMKVYLYDEDRWPSGFGGGKVTKDPAYRGRYLVFTPTRSEDRGKSGEDVGGSTARARAKGDGVLLARYEVTLKDGYLTDYRMLEDGEEGSNVWYAYMEVNAPSPWYNNEAYVNTLDKKAIDRFIETTHEPYYEALGEDFGELIPSIFTDEPQFVHKTVLGKAEDRTDIIIPYTDDFEETYHTAYQDSFLRHLPEVFWELPDGRVSVTRYRYHDHVAERFACAFSDTLGSWCSSHGIALTGHMMEEPTLQSQTAALGEAMRHYRGFKIPGIDMLCDRREYTTAKQAQSAAHQMGSNEITSELYGVTNWDFDFRGHKLQGDWQAALGVTHRVHHLSWMSMAGEAKRDYPASIFYQSPWYRRYGIIEDYFARVNTALQSGRPSVRVGVIHPVESYWLYFGPEEQTSVARERLERQFEQVTEWLLFGLVDFDYLSESLMLALGSEADEDGFSTGEMKYDAVIVPGCVTLRENTLNKLTAFAKKGGKVILMGDAPALVEAVPDDRPKALAELSCRIGFDYGQLMEALQAYRTVDVLDIRGVRSSSYLYQMRQAGSDRILFIANGRADYNPDVPRCAEYTVKVAGSYRVTRLDAMTGERIPCEAESAGGWTQIRTSLYDQDSLLVYLEDCADTKPVCAEQSGRGRLPVQKHLISTLNEVDSYEMSEPNVLLLDQAEYALDDEDFCPCEEVLRIDNILRAQLGYPLKMEALAQPWTQKEAEADSHTLTLRYHLELETEVKAPLLAMEDLKGVSLSLDGVKVPVKLCGYFTDECIKTAALPDLAPGNHILTAVLSYGRKTNLEWAYLLGDFGVMLCGSRARIVKKAEKIGFGDLTSQTFPFYAGNMTYCCETELSEGEYELEAAKFRAPLLTVSVDEGKEIPVFEAPYRAALGHLAQGRHRIRVTAYGSRVNAFGAVHNCDESTFWFGPDAWRTKGSQYSYEYQLKRTGILAAPKLYKLD